MLCPHCNTSFFHHWSNTGALVWDEETCIGQGIRYTLCPTCAKVIIRVVEGKVDINEDEFELDDQDEAVISNEFTVYPSPSEVEISEDIPETYKEEFIEAKAVLTSSSKASAAISRRLLQNLLQDEMGIKGNNLSKQIDSFLELPNVPAHLSKSVDAIRNIGNFAAHPNKEIKSGEIVNVEPGEADWLLEVLLSMFDFCNRSHQLRTHGVIPVGQ